MPLILRYPPGIPEGTVIEDRIVQSLDVAPTVLDLAGIEKPADMQGRSLVPLIRGIEPDWRPYAVSESPFADKKALITGKWKYIYTPGTRPLNPVLRVEQAPGRSLHNLEDDPRELRDVSAENPEIGGRLHAILLRLLPEAERARLAAKRDLEVHPDVVEQLKSLGYLQ